MKIQLKNIKHSPFASQETHCYEASVYFDGKKAGTVSNDGHGGCDMEYRENKEVWDTMTAYIEDMPSTESDMGGGRKFTMKPSLESICCNLVNDHLTTKDLKRLLKNRVLYVLDGQLYQTKCAKSPAKTLPSWITDLSENPEVEMILNSLDLKAALTAYRQYAG